MVRFGKLCVSLAQLTLLQWLGARLVWTVHNLRDHEDQAPKLERFFTALVVRRAAAMIVVGAVISAIAVFLPWLSADGESESGTGVFLTKDFELYDNPGSGVLFFAAVVFGLGVALFFAGRVLAVAIIAIVFAAIGLFVALGMIAIVNDTKDLLGTGSLGIGVILLTPAAGLSLAGSIWATSKRRRW